MEGYTMDVHRTMQAPDNTTSESPPFAEGDHAPSDAALHTLAPFRGFVPVYTPSMVRMPLTITPEEIATLTKSPREDEPLMEKKDEVPSTPTSSKAKGDSSPSPSPSPSQESEKTGHKRKRSDQSAAEVGSIMEDMRQAGAQDGITSTPASTQRPLGEGEAAFLSLVMQAANSEPIDDMSTEPTASLPDQLLESFIVRAHAMKDSSSSSSDDGLSGVGKKRKFDDKGDLNELHDDKTANMKEYSGLKMLRKTRSDALEGLNSLSREGSWSDDGNGDGDGGASVQSSNYAAEEGDRAMADANISASKRRPGRPPLKKESGDRRFEEWSQAEPVRRPPGRRGPGRPPKKQVSGGSEELFSFNEESLEGEKRDERGRGVGGRGVGSEDQRELEDADDEEGSAMLLESSDDGGGGKQRRRRNAAGVQTRRRDGARSFDNEDHELAWQERKDEESANDWRRRASTNGSRAGGSRADERIADEWNSDQEEDEEEEEDDDEDEWHDDEEDESWVDVSSDGENGITPEDDEDAAVVAELKAAEETRVAAEVMRREEEDLRRAIAASMAMTAAAPGTDDHQMVLSEPMPENPERAAVKVEPWVPAKTETPLTFRRLRPPWLDAFQEFQARGISLEDCKAEVEHTWQSFLAEGTDKRAWTKVPPTVTTWEGIVQFVQERARETQQEEDRERQERREKRKKELDQLAEDAKRAKEENAEEGEDNNEEEEEMEDGGDEEGERDDDEDEEDEEEIDDDDDDEDDGDDRRRSLYQRRTRSGGRKGGGRTKKKRDMVAQLLDCFKEKDLEKVLVVNAAARKRKPPRKYGIDEWYNRG